MEVNFWFEVVAEHLCFGCACQAALPAGTRAMLAAGRVGRLVLLRCPRCLTGRQNGLQGQALTCDVRTWGSAAAPSPSGVAQRVTGMQEFIWL